jgi:hypothetical protein
MINTVEGRARLKRLRAAIVANFSKADWAELGFETGHSNIINEHPRLLRSLFFGDDDYEACVLNFILTVAKIGEAELSEIEVFVNTKYPGSIGENVSSVPATRTIVFAPSVFTVPEGGLDPQLVGVMMPFEASFTPVHEGIFEACRLEGLTGKTVDDIWDHSTIIQDIFSLIFRSRIVVCDFTGRNPNVFYEAGIAHTLGKHVIPITQSKNDVPFDLQHHRYIAYLANKEGIASLIATLRTRLASLSS